MEDSILTSVKKVLGIEEADTSFDVDVMMHINSAFSTLNELGVGPAGGFMIEDAVPTWGEFIQDDIRFNSAKTLVYLKVRLVFDPPVTAHLLAAVENQIKELEWRLNTTRETDPPAPIVI